MKKFKIKKIIAATILLTTMATLTACGKQNTDNVESNPDNDNATVTESNTSEKEQNSPKTDSAVSMESLLSHPESPAEDFNYDTVDGFAYIYDYLGNASIVVIPETLDGCPVIRVSGLSHKGIQALKLSDSVESVGGFVFDEDLRYVVFGENMKAIEENGFVGCKNLVEIVLNDSLESIGAMALDNIGDDELHIPETVTEIGDAAFNMDSTQTVYVKAGSYAETYCKESKEVFENLIYVVE